MKLKNMKRLCLTSLILLTSCVNRINGNPYGFCPIAIHAPDAVVKDLNQYKFKPETVKYFYQVGVEQKDIEKYCK